MFQLILLFVSLAFADDAWLTMSGAGGLSWGTAEQPLDAFPRTRDLVLPDSGYLGRSPKDKPDDLEVPAPQGERRFLRYVAGQLVDAWWVKSGALPVSEFARLGDTEWEGVALGPAMGKDENGWYAFGDATSWRIGNRTVLYWKDRASNVEILASRTVPTGSYAVNRARALTPGIPSGVKPTIKGEMNRWAKPYAREISGCLDNSPKPVEAIVDMKWDDHGDAARIKATADQPAVELVDCIAGSLGGAKALPNQEGSFSLVRLH